MAKQKTDNELLQEINEKLDLLILVISLNGKDKEEQKKILKNYAGPLSKRELERATGIDRHEF
ncbi:MAG: hypothetical protein Q7R52_01550 [archaeon]|nr:hypothetical protein [archaeon]